MTNPEDVLEFWLEEIGPEGWYAGTAKVDDACRDRFGATWQDLHDGRLEDWAKTARGALAYLIVADQFARNIHRGNGKSFATDSKARAVARKAIERDWDLEFGSPVRQFFYMPLEHSENDVDQALAVRLFSERLPESPENLLHAKAHQAIIRRFGRFPFRNGALGRDSTAAEEEFMTKGAYKAFVADMRNKVEAEASPSKT